MMLRIERLTKRFGAQQVLDGLSLDIAAGESVALLGANGSGKTTLLRAIVGLSRPDGGRIVVDGVDALAEPKRARSRLSYVAQRPAFPPTIGVRETLRVVARLRRVPAAAVDRELAWCDLADRADQAVVRLSGGERQRLALALAFLADVPLYLFDEPTAHLDSAASALLFDRARGLAREGRTILFTTHIAADLGLLPARAERLVSGRIRPKLNVIDGGDRPSGDLACRTA